MSGADGSWRFCWSSDPVLTPAAEAAGSVSQTRQNFNWVDGGKPTRVPDVASVPLPVEKSHRDPEQAPPP